MLKSTTRMFTALTVIGSAALLGGCVNGTPEPVPTTQSQAAPTDPFEALRAATSASMDAGELAEPMSVIDGTLTPQESLQLAPGDSKPSGQFAVAASCAIAPDNEAKETGYSYAVYAQGVLIGAETVVKRCDGSTTITKGALPDTTLPDELRVTSDAKITLSALYLQQVKSSGE